MEVISEMPPIILQGDNLGERHRQLNVLVSEACNKYSPEAILSLPDGSDIDGLFRIDFASKHRNVDFILGALKNENMLYVCKALKSTWILEAEYQNIINPEYLETQLYPYMLAPAVNKMKQWIQNNMKDSKRCQHFYEYYADYNLNIKFLYHCTPEFIIEEFSKIIDGVTPKQLKILSEYCPNVLKIYYENFTNSCKALDNFLMSDRRYIDCCKYALKSHPDVYFDIIEKYYDSNRYKCISRPITEYIMRKHKSRFLNKSELYAAWLLHKETVAKYLSSDEAKDLVLRLARAKYLNNWFSYKSVEAYMKRIKPEERAAFRTQVFVEKAIGETVEEWPYLTPSCPVPPVTENVFEDPIESENIYTYRQGGFKRCLRKRKMCYYTALNCPMAMSSCRPMRTLLDELFDKYRFCSFDHTLQELQKLLRIESSVKNREFMMLVLVSKCGENMEQAEKLLAFLAARYKNESNNLRATIVRSFVTRACIWRLQSKQWNLLLDFGRDLGLDGSAPINCREGMHAAMLRVLLYNEDCPQVLRSAFLEDFTDFTKFKLNSVEQGMVRTHLPKFLLTATKAEPEMAIDYLKLLLYSLENLRIPVENCPGALETLIAAVKRDPPSAVDLLTRLYKQRIARRELFKENFDLFKTNQSFLNALRHDTTILKSPKNYEETLKTHKFNYDGFLKKLLLYFGEKGGLAVTYTEVTKRLADQQPHTTLARPLALLETDINPIIELCLKSPTDSPRQRLGIELQSNFSVRRPSDVDTIDWGTSSAKAIHNRVVNCKAVDIKKYIRMSLDCPRMLKLSLLLAEKNGDPAWIYEAVAVKKPSVALRSAISYFKRKQSGEANVEVWRKVAPALNKIDFSLPKHRYLKRSLLKGYFVPPNLQAEYWTDVFKALKTTFKGKVTPKLSMKLETLLPDIDSNVILEMTQIYMKNLPLDLKMDSDYLDSFYIQHLRIIAKFLLLSKSESEQNERIKNVWAPFYDLLSHISSISAVSVCLTHYLKSFVAALKYNKAFFNRSLFTPVPVFERIAADLQKLLPMEAFIEIFINIQVIMLYRHALEQTLEHQPEVLKDVKSKQNKGATVVGTTLGKFVGYEVKEAAEKNFKSVVNIYEECLAKYLEQEFRRDVKDRFSNSFIEGLIDAGNTEALRVAEFLLHRNRYKIDADSEKQELIKRLKDSDSEQIKFFLYADFYSGCLSVAD